MKVWLKYCKKTGLTIDELLSISQEIVFNYRKSIIKYIYDREREQNPKKSEGEIRKEIRKQFNIGKKLLEAYLLRK